MLRPAILLDAAMTVGEARTRLAQHGYWNSTDDPNVRAVLQARVDAVAASRKRLNKANGSSAKASYRRPRGESAPPRQTEPVMKGAIDIGNIETAAKQFAHPLAEGRVAIRRAEGTRIFWYARKVGEVLETIKWSSDAAILRDALALRERDSSNVQQVDTIVMSELAQQEFEGVVLRGPEFVSISEKRVSEGASSMTTAPRAPRASAPPSSSAPGRSRSTSAALPPRPGDGVRGGAVAPEKSGSDGQPDGATVHAYPRVESPEYVSLNQPFALSIGLGMAPMAGQPSSAPMTLTAAPNSETIVVDVQVVADGFDAPDGWNHTLNVALADPTSAFISIRLIPRGQDIEVRATSIGVHYAVGGVTRGSITRRVAVLPPGVSPVDAKAPANSPPGTDWLSEQPPPSSITTAATTSVPDIELNLAKADANGAQGIFLCTMRNAHGLPVPSDPIKVDLGNDPRTFAKLILDEMPRYDGLSLLNLVVQGHGATIAAKLPQEFWKLLHDVAQKVGDARSLTLQLNSADAYVPWELALVDPPIDNSRVPLLAAQVSMGRWILGESAVPSPPREQLEVRNFALMAGMYKAEKSGMKKLPKAEEEVKELCSTFGTTHNATSYDCDPNALSVLLSGSVGGGAQAVHFAGHGQVDPSRPGDAAIYLSNGLPISPVFFRRSPVGLKNSPFLFLNACMVGTAGEMLGDYGGFPGACLAGHFSGLVAPLWAVNDVIAKWISLEFYREAMSKPSRPVADILRDLRQTFAERPESSTYIAYVYYGNPYLTLT